MKFFASKRTQRLTNFALAGLLVMSTLTASVPFFFSQKANAVGPISICAGGCNAATVQAAIDAATPGDVISLDGNVTAENQITINKSLTLNGNNFVISPTFAKPSPANGQNNATLGIEGTTGVVVNNLVVDGTGGTNIHGINAFKATASLNDVTVQNNTRYGLVVNGSNVTVNNIATAGNAWGGIDVDQSSTSNVAVLTVNGTSSHVGQAGAHIYVDNDTKPVTLNGTNGQYTWSRSGLPGRTHDRVYLNTASQVGGTVPVTGNTSAAENSPGWMFNRDTTTATPFVFNNDTASIGSGSLFVKPIGTNPSDKFVGELFLANQKITDTHAISYDINVASAGATDYKQFYTNVYANFAGSPANKYYDCRYNVVPTASVAGTFAKVTFDPSTAYAVTTSGSSPAVCPVSPVDMGPGATIRAFAINVGDTSASDAGVSGYIDNVVVDNRVDITTYDFEAVASSAPSNLQWLNSSTSAVLGAFTNQNPTTPAWNAPTTGTVDHYEYSFRSPTTGWSAWESVGNVTNLGPNTFYGAGNTGTEGEWQYRVRTINNVGLASTEAYSPAITYDRTAPSAPTITTPTSDQFFKVSPITNTWSTVVDASGVAKYQIAYQYADGHTFGGTNTCAGDTLTIGDGSGFIGCRDVAGTSRSHAPALSEQGAVTIWVRAIDNAGNKGAWSSSVKYTYDATLPAVAIAGVSVSSGANKIATITGNATDTHFKYYYCYVTNGSGEVGVRDALCQTAWAAGTPFQTAFTPTVNGQPGGLIGSVDMTGLASGNYTAYLVAYDKAGNVGATTGFAFTIDNTAPVVAITSPISGSTFGNGSQITIEGSTGDASSYTLSIGNTGETPLVTDTGTTFSSYIWDTSAVASGSYIATLTATDAAGNSETKEIVITIDNTAPTLVIAPQTNTAGNLPTVTGTVNDEDATLVATFNGGTYPIVNNAGTFSFTAPVALNNGTYTFSLTATDANGNQSTQTADVVVAVIAPATTPSTTVTPAITGPSSAVLGATTERAAATTNDSGVKGTTSDKTLAAAANSEQNKGTIFGLAWFWWILILAALAAIAWFIIAAIRRRNEEQA